MTFCVWLFLICITCPLEGECIIFFQNLESTTKLFISEDLSPRHIA
jgi:hypothetical protein